MTERKVADPHHLATLVTEGLSLQYKTACFAHGAKIEEAGGKPIWRAHVVTPEGSCYAGIEAPPPLEAVEWGLEAVKVIVAYYKGKKERRGGSPSAPATR